MQDEKFWNDAYLQMKAYAEFNIPDEINKEFPPSRKFITLVFWSARRAESDLPRALQRLLR